MSYNLLACEMSTIVEFRIKSKHLEAPHDPSGPDCLSELLYYLFLHSFCVLVGFLYSSHVLCSFQPHAFLYFPFSRLRICFFTSTPPVIIWTSVQMIPPRRGVFPPHHPDSCPFLTLKLSVLSFTVIFLKAVDNI